LSYIYNNNAIVYTIEGIKLFTKKCNGGVLNARHNDYKYIDEDDALLKIELRRKRFLLAVDEESKKIMTGLQSIEILSEGPLPEYSADTKTTMNRSDQVSDAETGESEEGSVGSSSRMSLVSDCTALVSFWTSVVARDNAGEYERQVEKFFTLKEVTTINCKIEQAESAWQKSDMEMMCNAIATGEQVVGYCYAAWNMLFADLIKIGYTMRTPAIRLRELSGTGIPEPFELVAVLPCTNPIVMEREIHSHFAAVRKYGKKKEFFTLTREAVAIYFDSLVVKAMAQPRQNTLKRDVKRARKDVKLQQELQALKAQIADLKAMAGHGGSDVYAP